MQNFFRPIVLLGISIGLTLPALGQQAPPTTGRVFDKALPDDLPTAKLLFVQFRPVAVPAERPKSMSPGTYKLLQQHAIEYPRANEQLAKVAVHYPFAYRITTRDSTAYYYEHGYKYVLFHQSFGAYTDGYFKEADSTTDIFIDLYLQDLSSRDKYIVGTFNQTSLYNYKSLVGMLLKRVEKQFQAKK